MSFSDDHTYRDHFLDKHFLCSGWNELAKYKGLYLDMHNFAGSNSVPGYILFKFTSIHINRYFGWILPFTLEGFFFERSTDRPVNGSLSLSTILYRHQPHATRCNGAFCFGKQQSLILRLLLHVLHLNNVCRCTSQLPLRGSFSKSSTGQWVKRVTSQWCM